MIQEIVGVGGMGRVYRAEQTSLGRTVGIKVIHPHLLGDEQTVARFYTEARAASRLNHPNSVSIIDFGRTDDGILYLAMEFLKGKDLAMVMQDEGPLPFKRICDILTGVLDALGEAHALDIVHRDLKPENVILRKMRAGEELVKVVDFGLATIVGGSTSITRPGLVCGTPDYMSPEQGRGEDVDGRGDLYAAGVVLFELLTDQLPFDDETPTKVVLRHINDPVPDPRETAPHRKIPDGLAEVTIKALAKRRDQRYQDADEMSQALKRARDAFTSNKAAVLECPSCGSMNPSNMRFCGSCGSRIAAERVVAETPRARPRVSFYPTLASGRAFVGRKTQLERLEGLRQEATDRLVRVSIEGEAGVGKTRLLNEMATRFAEDGDVVSGAGAHAFGVPVPYGTIRQIVAALLEVEPKELGRLARDADAFPDALTRAGLDELDDPRGIVGLERPRVGAVATALASAVRAAMKRTNAERTVLVVDDASRCDGLSLATLDEVAELLAKESVLLVTAKSDARGGAGERIELQGLTLVEAGTFLDSEGDNRDSKAPVKATLPAPGRLLLPLYLEQIHALGAGAVNDDSLPPRLADAVAQRIERLDVRARRALQAIAAFGGKVDLGELREVIEHKDMDGLDQLANEGLILIQGTGCEIAHPFIAELVEAFIPASARKDLHARILDLKTKASARLEVRAEHAYRGGEMLPTLMTLERMGDVAVRRGDPRAGVLAFRRALEIARREMLETGETVMDTAIVTFSRKLGWALAHAGDLAGADGVVREVLDLTNRNDPNRARMHLVLGRVAIRRDRRRDAMRHFGQALEIVAGEEPLVESEVQVELGRLRRDSGDPGAAANAYRRALELYGKLDRPLERVLATLELAEVLFAAGERDTCVKRAKQAEQQARASHAPALEARAIGLLGRVHELDGDLATARDQYRTAAQRAAEAGDATESRRWIEAGELVQA